MPISFDRQMVLFENRRTQNFSDAQSDLLERSFEPAADFPWSASVYRRYLTLYQHQFEKEGQKDLADYCRLQRERLDAAVYDKTLRAFYPNLIFDIETGFPEPEEAQTETQPVPLPDEPEEKKPDPEDDGLQILIGFSNRTKPEPEQEPEEAQTKKREKTSSKKSRKKEKEQSLEKSALIDSYVEQNRRLWTRAIFWITLAVSFLVVLFGGILNWPLWLILVLAVILETVAMTWIRRTWIPKRMNRMIVSKLKGAKNSFARRERCLYSRKAAPNGTK